MPTDSYDAEHISSFFDAYDEREWQRFEKSALDRVGLHLHIHYLKGFIKPGTHVLDAGAGPGRFTIELAKLGAKVTVGDISAGQLEHNRRRLEQAGLEEAVTTRHQLDITDLSQFEDESFDAVVCYGGPISYVMDRADDAVAELLRVARPEAPVLLSVMSKVGAMRIHLPGVLEITREHGLAFVEGVLNTGVLTGEANFGHAMKMYAWADFNTLLEKHGAKILLASASNHLTTSHPDVTEGLWEREPELWQHLLDWETRLCAEPGNVDGGTHIIVVVERTTEVDDGLSRL